MVDIHEWDHEESTVEREKLKMAMTEMIKTSVTANKGSIVMVKRVLRKDATIPKFHKCYASFIWYSVGQMPAKVGETNYDTETGWHDRSANWS